MSKKLHKYAQRVRLALAIALGLTILSTVATPLLSDELAKVLPGPGVVLAEESEGHGG